MTLTEVIYYFRKFAPFVLGLGVFFVIVFFIIRFYLGYLDAQKPKPLAIDPIFGKIQRISIPNTFGYPQNPQFILDTIEGVPKTATDTAKVFFLPPRSPRFGYLSKIYLMAKMLGFDTEVAKHKIADQKAVFEDSEKSLEIDIAYFNFSFDRQFDQNAGLFNGVLLPQESEINEKTKGFLTSLDRYPEELATGKVNIIYMRYDPAKKEFTPVEEKKEANVFEIDFFRGDIDGFPVIPQNYFTSSNFLLGTFKEGKLFVLRAAIQFYEKEVEKVGVYPIKTGDEAWVALLNKGDFIVSAGKTDTLVIKKMFLGYLDLATYEEYLRPVYAFLSDDGFVAYVPAIQEAFVE